METGKYLGTAIGISDYGKKYMPDEDVEELLGFLPSKIYECDEVNSMNEPLVYLSDSNVTAHEIMLIIEK